jgi:hypothetical protein
MGALQMAASRWKEIVIGAVGLVVAVVLLLLTHHSASGSTSGQQPLDLPVGGSVAPLVLGEAYTSPPADAGSSSATKTPRPNSTVTLRSTVKAAPSTIQVVVGGQTFFRTQTAFSTQFATATLTPHPAPTVTAPGTVKVVTQVGPTSFVTQFETTTQAGPTSTVTQTATVTGRPQPRPTVTITQIQQVPGPTVTQTETETATETATETETETATVTATETVTCNPTPIVGDCPGPDGP